MIFLILAILSSAAVAIVMRLSSHRVKGNFSMLAVNYLMCMVIAGFYTGWDRLFPDHPALWQTIGMGSVNGFFYLAGFVLLQLNTRRNGVVLSSIFLRLGLLVPMGVSMLVFREMPAPGQAVGFVIALGAIVLINWGKSEGGTGRGRLWLVVMLLAGGAGDAMSKIYEQLGSAALSSQFLYYTFQSALILCAVLVIRKKEKLGRAEVLFGLLIGLPNYFSARFLLLSLSSVPAVIAYPTYSVATILTVTLAGVLFFKERLQKRQWLAVGIILVAIALLNL